VQETMAVTAGVAVHVLSPVRRSLTWELSGTLEGRVPSQEESQPTTRPMFVCAMSESSFLYPTQRSFTMLTFLKSWMTTHLPKDEKGQDAAEYAIMIALIAIVIIVAVTALGTQISAVFDYIVTKIPVP